MMFIMPFVLVLASFGPFRLQESESINYTLENLMHPIYPIAKYDPDTEEWTWGHLDGLALKEDMQNFMWYNDYHNDLFKNSSYTQPSADEKNQTKKLLM